MIRNAFVCVLSGLSLVLIGCNKSNEPPQKAATAKSGLMPAEEPGFEAVYVADQKDVKLAARDVSYDALSDFRERNAEAAKAKAAPAKVEKAAKPEAEEGPGVTKDAGKPVEKPKVAKQPKRGGKPGLFSRMKNAALGKVGQVGQLVPGGRGARPPAAGKPAGKPAKAEPAKKEKEKAEAEDDEEDETGKDDEGETEE